jgi:hypothetical protein
MATELFTVSDYRKWGHLVMAWSTGMPVPGSGGFAPSKPTTLDELKAQCATIGLTITIPDYLTKINILDGAKDTLTVRLPAKELIEETKADLSGPDDYRLPPFYADLFGHPPLPMTAQRKLELQAERIGDYSVGMCM